MCSMTFDQNEVWGSYVSSYAHPLIILFHTHQHRLAIGPWEFLPCSLKFHCGQNNLSLKFIRTFLTRSPFNSRCSRITLGTFSLSKAAFILILRRQNQRFETLIQNAHQTPLIQAIVRAQVNRKAFIWRHLTWLYVILRSCFHQNQRFALTTIVNAHFWPAFMLILRRRFETLIQNADPKRRSRKYCSCFPREEDDTFTEEGMSRNSRNV